MDLGGRIRKHRLQQNRTLKEIADACGFTDSLLSKIERGKTVPPVSTLVKIAEALHLKVSTLFNEAEEYGTVFHGVAESRKDLITTNKGYSFFAFAQERPNKAFQPFLFEARKESIKRKPLTHTGEEFVYMLEGTMKYRVGKVEYTLGPGDSLYFDSEHEHDLTPVTDFVRYLAVFTERSSI